MFKKSLKLDIPLIMGSSSSSSSQPIIDDNQNNNKIKSFQLFEFNSQAGKWQLYGAPSPLPQHQSITSPPQPEFNKFSLLTFNIWFNSDYFLEQRTQHIANVLIPALASSTTSTSVVDFICLQEVIIESYRLLTESHYLREHYLFPFDPSAASPAAAWWPIHPYGSCTLVSKRIVAASLASSASSSFVPIGMQVLQLPSYMGRNLVSLNLKLCAPTQHHFLNIHTVHLESLNQADSREQQLKLCSDHFKEQQKQQLQQQASNVKTTTFTTILCGDFNFDSTTNYNPIKDGDKLENDNLKKHLSDFTDLWPHLHSDSPGYTFDTSTNCNISFKLGNHHREELMRYDRIMVKTQTLQQQQQVPIGCKSWQAKSIRLVGTEPLDQGEYKELMPSDHYGLYAEFEFA